MIDETPMPENIPRWANEKLSSELAKICEVGESETVEFKESIPQQADKLSKEFAALGSSGGGKVLIGINDNCEIIGIELSDADERDDFIERVHGIVNKVSPPLKFESNFAIRDTKIVYVIEIPKQEEPIFYFNEKPYIRDVRRSRPARPNEVKELVWSHPSSEYKREEERLKLQKERNHIENMQHALRPRR